MPYIVKNKEIEMYKNKRREAAESGDFPIYKRIRLNQLGLEPMMPYHATALPKVEGAHLFPISAMNEFGAVLLEHEHHLSEVLEPKDTYGVDEKFNAIAEGYANTGFLYYGPKGHHALEPIHIHYQLTDEAPTLLEHNIVVADAGASVTVVLHYEDDLSDDFEVEENQQHFKAYHIGVTKIYAHKEATVRVYKIRHYSNPVLCVDATVAQVSRDAKVVYPTVDLGAGVLVTDYTAHLKDNEAMSEVIAAYMGTASQRMDIGYHAHHYGPYSESRYISYGALKDQAYKVFRGNLKFHRGSRRAFGMESESVILLNQGVVSDAIPALLCQEDDVRGEHAASAGQVDDDLLFYLMSRGLNRQDAMALVVQGHFASVLSDLPDEALKDHIETVLLDLLN